MAMRAKKLRCFINFCDAIHRMGGRVLITFEQYNNNKTPIPCICPKGHHVSVTAANIDINQGMCKVCAGKCSIEAERKFREKMEEMKVKIIGIYIDSITRVDCICSEGHLWKPRPTDITCPDNQICPLCSDRSPVLSKVNFEEAIEKDGGTVLGKYQDQRKFVRCLCNKGHIYYIKPRNLECRGRDFCPMCNGRVPIIQELNFRNSVTILGGKVIGNFVFFPTK
jgi:hypothetical protein